MIPPPHRDRIVRSLLNGAPIDEVEAAIAAGQARLWTAPGAAGVTQVLRVMEIVAAGGELRALRALYPEVEAAARAQGCAAILIAGRGGWRRALPGLEGPMPWLWKSLTM